MSKPVAGPDEFAAAMQQLSAEAEKTIAPDPVLQPPADAVAASAAQQIETRLQQLEVALSNKIEDLLSIVRRSKDRELLLRFQKIEEQLTAIRNTESVNQRLFDSLHDELLKYRDNFVHESLQKPFIHDLVHLFDDLTNLANQLRSAAEEQKNSGPILRWRDNLENAIHSLIEILHRLEVKEIDPSEMVDRSLHRVVSHEPADYAEDDGRIVMRLKRGFFWRGNLIRPEEVIAKRFG